MLTANKTAHNILIKALVKIQASHPFFSYILMNFSITAAKNKSVPTAGVDRFGNFYYDEQYIKDLDKDEVIGLLAHETLHIAKGDFFRMRRRDAEIWNIATDMVINYILVQENFKVPSTAIRPDRYGDIILGKKSYNVADKTSEEVYAEIYENADKIKQQLGGGMGGDGDGNGKSYGFDVHIGDREGTTQSEVAAARGKWEKAVVAAATSAKARGSLPGCMEGIVDKILHPVIDWRARIQKFITNEIPVDYTNRLPNRTFYATGIWAPRILRENLEVFISVDVSGSTMPDREYFIGEVSGIINAYEQIKARLIFWDYNVNPANDFAITPQNKMDLTKLKVTDCNGGTNLSCYADYCEEKGYKCRLHVILTDGEIEHNPKVPDGNLIFVLTKNGMDDHIKDLGAVCRLTDTEEGY